MKLAIKCSFLLLLTAFSSFIFAVERDSIPDPTEYGYIHDYVNILKPNEVLSIFNKLKAYEDSTSTQIAVIIEESLRGRDVFDRAMDFARPELNPKWNGGVGQKGKRNGVIFYIAMSDRKIFILPADKTQGALPDGLVGSIIRNDIRPYFKNGSYYAGIQNGLDQMIAALEGEFSADPQNSEGSYLPFFIFIAILILLIYLQSKGGGSGGRGYHKRGTYWFPTGTIGSGRGGWSGGGGGFSGGGFGGFGGGGGFNGGGAGGGW